MYCRLKSLKSPKSLRSRASLISESPVLLKQLREDAIVLIERRARLGSLCLIGGQQEAAHVHPDFGKASGNVAEHRNASELRLRDESAALLDL